MVKRLLCVLAAMLLIAQLLTPMVFALTENDFSDLYSTEFGDSCSYVIRRGLMQGVAEYIFDPQGYMTREMMVTLIGRLWELLVGPVTVTEAPAFQDVPAGHWYSKYIAWASEKGIVKGLGERRFGLGMYITREAAAVMLVRFLDVAGITLKEPPDGKRFESSDDKEDISDWAYAAVEKLVNAEIIQFIYPLGDAYAYLTTAPIAPQKPLIRSHAANMVYSLLKAIDTPT